jgi:TonB-linked SusC/RagA family outer membrane protein
MQKTLLSFIILLSGYCSLAQTAKITGTVSSSDDGTTLPGVTIYVKGSTVGTVTDKEGKFSLEAEGGSTIVISHIGYKLKEVLIEGDASLAVVLDVDINTLDEIVVVGYGTAKSRDLTGSITKVNFSEEINTSLTRSFETGLQGRALGVQVIQSNGVPGSAVRVRVRGQNSFTGSGDPLYVVDGVPIYSGDFSMSGGDNTVRASNSNVLATINPADIESVEVLKDAAASAIYGARGANGVIVITTKKGGSGATRFNVSYSAGQSQETNRLKLISAQDWWTLYNEARVNDGDLPIDPAATTTINGVQFIYNDIKDVNTDWIDEMLRKGSMQDFNLSARGGSEKTQFYIGAGYKTEEGILKGNDFSRLNGRVNIDNQATKNVKIGIQSSISHIDNQQVPTSFGGGIGAAQSTALRLFPVYNADGSHYGTQLTTPNTGANPVARLESTFTTKSTRFINNLYADIKLMKDLSFRAEYGLDILDQFEERYDHNVNRYYKASTLPVIGLAARWERRLNIRNMNANAYFSYHKMFAEHSLNVTVGSSVQDSKTTGLGFTPADGSVGFLNDYFTETSANMVIAPGSTYTGTPIRGYNERDFYRFLSFFARANYKLRDRYLIGASIRADGSSRFGPKNRYGYFPAVSAGWIISEESFMQNISKIDYLKLRASYGYTGNSEIGNFKYLGTFSTTGGYLGFSGITPTRLANPNLTWEKASQLDVAVEFGLFGSRFTGSVGFYRKISTDVLLDKPAPTSATGLSTLLYNAEDVKVRNAGLEIELTGTVITTGNFSWVADLNIAGNRNEVVETGGIPPDGFGAAAGDTRVVQGYPIGISYLAISAGVNPETGNEMIYTLEGDKIDALKQSDITNNRQAVGHPFPNFFGGLNNTLKYKNFDLSFLFAFSEGNQIYDDGAKRQIGGFINSWNQRTEVLDRWQQSGDITDIPKLTLKGASFTGSDRNSSRFLYDASYIRLRNVSLGYNLPKALVQRIKFANARIYVSGTNLLTFSKYKGWDPEVSRYGFSNGESNIAFDAPYLPTPQAKSFIAGIDLSF